MHQSSPTPARGGPAWRWAAALALLLTMLGGSFAQGAVAAPVAAPAPKAHPATNPHPQTPAANRQVAPAGAGAQGIATPNGGSAYGFGYNDDLYFCNGDFGYNDAYAPSRNIYLDNVTAVSATEYAGFYLRADGTLYGCGYTGQGQLGNGSNNSDDYGTPQQVLGVCPSLAPVPQPPSQTPPDTNIYHTAAECGHLTNVASVASGYYHSLATDTAGNVYAWGDNEYGGLGTGNNFGPEVCSIRSQYTDESGAQNYFYTGCSTAPVRVPGLTNVKQVVGGDYFSVALKADGTVWAWGYNYYGETGQDPNTSGQCAVYGYNGGTYTNPCVVSPTQVQGLPAIVQIATGMDADHVLALDATGHVWSWGLNGDGQLGRVTDGQYDYVPGQVSNADGTGVLSGVALPDAARPHLERIGANDYSSYAVMADGSVYAWGYNNDGQLGNNTTTDSTYPVRVLGVDGVGFLANIAAVGSGSYGTGYAITNGGDLLSWGYNSNGEMGIGSESGQGNLCNSCYVTPQRVTTLRNVQAVSGSDEGWALAVAGDQASASASSVAFGNQTVGTTSAPRAATLTNSGSGPLTVSGVTIAGANAGDFAQSGGCAGAIQPGASCSVFVTFTPTATGARAATLTFATSGGNVAVALSGTGVASVATYTIAASVSGNGGVTPAGTTTYNSGATATYTATAATGQTFTGWTLDGQYVGFANPLTITVAASHTLVATFVATPRFTDIGTLPAADQQAITFLAALGIVNPQGVNGSGEFRPAVDVARAEMAAFVARTFGWESEFHANTFPDRCVPGDPANCIDAKLWNDVAALKDYGIVGGYTDAATCQAAGTTAPCYLPRDGVQRVQVVSIVARAFIKTPDLRPTGFWDRLAADPAQYTNVSTEGTQRSDLTTYRANAGEIPGQASSATFADPTGNGKRLFVVEVLYQAFAAQFGVDRVP